MNVYSDQLINLIRDPNIFELPPIYAIFESMRETNLFFYIHFLII